MMGFRPFRRRRHTLATVRQSITALYEESRKFAVDGAPMMAVITSAAADGAPAVDGPVEVRPLAAPEPAAIVARFEELRRLAEIEARQTDDDHSDRGQADFGNADFGQVEENVTREILTRNTGTAPFASTETAAPATDLVPPSFGDTPTADMPEQDTEILSSTPVTAISTQVISCKLATVFNSPSFSISNLPSSHCALPSSR